MELGRVHYIGDYEYLNPFANYDSSINISQLFGYKLNNLLEIGPGLNDVITKIDSVNVYSIDINLNVLKMHTKKKNTLLMNANSHHMPFKDNSFDGVIVINCPRLFIESFSEIYRVLKQGKDAISYNSPDYIHFRWEDLFYNFNSGCGLIYDNNIVRAKKLD